jgi:hypothetical protein
VTEEQLLDVVVRDHRAAVAAQRDRGFPADIGAGIDHPRIAEGAIGIGAVVDREPTRATGRHVVVRDQRTPVGAHHDRQVGAARGIGEVQVRARMRAPRRRQAGHRAIGRDRRDRASGAAAAGDAPLHLARIDLRQADAAVGDADRACASDRATAQPGTGADRGHRAAADIVDTIREARGHAGETGPRRHVRERREVGA